MSGNAGSHTGATSAELTPHQPPPTEARAIRGTLPWNFGAIRRDVAPWPLSTSGGHGRDANTMSVRNRERVMWDGFDWKSGPDRQTPQKKPKEFHLPSKGVPPASPALLLFEVRPFASRSPRLPRLSAESQFDRTKAKSVCRVALAPGPCWQRWNPSPWAWSAPGASTAGTPRNSGGNRASCRQTSF